MSKRLLFTLTMSSVGSWNGQWSGEGKNYTRVRTVQDSVAAELNGRSFPYRWEDGWAAVVSVRQMNLGERKPKSDGFCGYDLMISNILSHRSASPVELPEEKPEGNP
jgi:hypothetical protein